MSDDLQKMFDEKVGKKPPIRKSALFGILIILIFIGGFMSWASLAPLESAAVATGKIIVAGNRRTIQHLEGGIVSSINVKDGSKVKKGDVLLTLEKTQADASLMLRSNEVNELLAIEARLEAERSNAQNITFPERLTKTTDPKMLSIINGQEAIFKANKLAHDSKKDVLNQRVTQLDEQIQGYEAQVKSLDTQIKLIKEEIVSTAYLEKKKLIERSRLLALQRELAKLTGVRGETIANISSLKQKIGETKLQIASLESDRMKEILDQLRETRQKLADALEKEKVAQDVLTRIEIRSPIDGTVVGLKVFTVGGVVKAGEPIMDIVPSNEPLEVEAQVSPLDIDVVHQGLVAKVQLTAFKTRSTPTLIGTVSNVSADVFTNQQTGESYYQARIKIDRKELQKIEKGKELYPGMPVQVLIITGKLTPWQYFIAPIKNSFNRAFREE